MIIASVFVAASNVVQTTTSSDTCRACNCQLNNIQILEQLVEEKVNNALASLPIIQLHD